MNLREQIFQTNDLQEEMCEIPEWNCQVLIRAMTGADRANLLQHAMLKNGQPDLVKLYPNLAIASIRDPETKELVFKPEDRDHLALKSGAALERVAQAAMKINGMLPEQIKVAEQTF